MLTYDHVITYLIDKLRDLTSLYIRSISKTINLIINIYTIYFLCDQNLK